MTKVFLESKFLPPMYLIFFFMHVTILCVVAIWPLYERDNTGLKPKLQTVAHSML